MVRKQPIRVSIPINDDEATKLIDLANQIPRTTHSTVAKACMLYGMQHLASREIEALLDDGLARRPGRTKPRTKGA